MGDLNPFGGGGGSNSSSNAGSAFGSQIGDAFAGLQDTFSNLFGGGGAQAALTGDATGMSGFDPSGLFSNIGSDAFNQDTSSIQATQAITPPAQAEANAASGQDPSAGVGGTQTGTQTASTGPGGQSNQPSQEQQDQEQRNKGIDELRRLLKQRQKQQQQPPQWNPRYAAAPVQAQPGIGRGAGAAAGLYSPNISPDAAVRAGLLAPEMIDPTTGTIRRDQPPAAEDPLGSSVEISPRAPPALPDPSGPTGAGQVVPRAGTDVLPPRTVPGTPGTTPPTLPAPQAPLGIGSVASGLGNVAARALPFAALPLGVLQQLLWNTTPAETGELPSKYWPKPEDAGPEDPEIRARQREGMSPGQRPDQPAQAAPDAPLPPRRPKDQPKPKPHAAQPPRRVWVPPTPGHYVPTPGLGRGQPTWVRGTPGHYVESPAPGQGRPLAAVAPGASVQARNAAEAAPRLSEARAEAPPEAMAYNQDARISPMLRDILGIGMPQTMAVLARLSGQGRPARPNFPSSEYGRGGTRPYNENWGGAPYAAKGDEVQRGRQYMGYLTGKGLTRQGAAALLGNAHQESNLSATLAPGGDGGTAAGMFQWRGSRQVAFRRWLQANGRSESDPQAHLDFALLEMQSDPRYRASWNALHDPNMSPAQIADIIANNYEGSLRGPSQGMNNRIGFANSMLQGGATAAAPAPAPVPIQASGGDARA